MSESKGYVVTYAMRGRRIYVASPEWLTGYMLTPDREDEGTMFATLGAATAAARHPSTTEKVTIFAVSPDGTETSLPTYEEALNALAMARGAAETALRAHGARGMGGAPSELEGCPPGALRALLRLLGGAR